jgi:hypothetical protein
MIYQEIIEDLNSNYKEFNPEVKIDENSNVDDLIQHIETIYNNITDRAIIKYNKFKQNKDLSSLSEYKYNLNNNIKNMRNEAMTNKRLVEIKINQGRRTEYIMNILKICLVIAGCMVVFPILNKLGILDKTNTLFIWGMCVSVMVLVILYFVYVHINIRDKNDFNAFVFQNPNSQLVAQSKIDVNLSEEDYARCKAFEEVNVEYDEESVNDFSIDKYITPESQQKCK